MGVVDLIIIILILSGFVIGWKNGFTKQLISTVGLIVLLALSYVIKNPLSALMYKYLPFFDFGGSFKGVSVLNVFIYEFLAFLIILSILQTVFRILLNTSTLFENILKYTIILGIPSKILGGIIGCIENFVVTFIILFFLNLPFINIPMVRESNLSNFMLNNTPVLSNVCNDALIVFDEIRELKSEYEKNKTNKDEFNSKVLTVMVKHNVISKENIDYLISVGKIKYVEYGD